MEDGDGTKDEQEQHDTLKRFADALNYHGHPFQNAVIEEIKALHELGVSRWRFEAAEFPVQIRGRDTRIDFILSLPPPGRVSLIGECKRVNPAYSDWLFAKSSNISRNHYDAMIVDSVAMHGDIRAVTVRLRDLTSDVFNLGIDVKTGKKGDPKGSSGNVIDETATQVMRGVSGLIESMKDFSMAAIRNLHPIFLPVIFTTAKLMVTDFDLADADLATGEVSLSKLEPREVPFLYYQYHTSVSSKPDLRQPPGSSIADSFSRYLRHAFIRTIPIVNAGHIATFFKRLNPETFSTLPLDPANA